MKKVDFPDSGFHNTWYFYEDIPAGYPTIQALQKGAPIPDAVFEDIRHVLAITIQHELLIPTYIRLDDVIEIENDSLDTFMAGLKKVLADKQVLSIFSIGGYGKVLLPDDEPGWQQDLITLEDVLFFDRDLNISTAKSVWVPISIDDSHQFQWQLPLAKLNAGRLELALQEIKQALKISDAPPDEPDPDSPFVIKDFKLFLRPEIIRNKKDYDILDVDLSEFIVEE
ncbi:hypothetical protein CLV51_109124 [Chitinophaga niastensis]|uniref:Uncharacterized protein n=1 Tax=Chitinophaga niastensis TaxID=536980 RepID=A0A2P8HAB0_CHINA|nr:hypothetical protein [Chitinophaga niastensis]PSL43130.1 hypothetical protein CLV51_109124 [Chitinophaga niastensis]